MNRESGNVLIFILIAVILIGVLTVSLTRSSNTTNETGNFEQNQIAATEILRYAKSLEVGVQNLLARGCGENQISFWHDSDGNSTEDAGDDYYNANSPTDRSCHVFEPEGAGIFFVTPKDNIIVSSHTTAGIFFGGGNTVEDVGTGPLNSAQAAEIIYTINGLSEGICNIINKNIGITSKPDNQNFYAPSARFTGNFSASGQIREGEIDGNYTGCFYSNTVSMDSNVFYHVLHAR